MARKKRKAVIDVGSSDDSDKDFEALSDSESEDLDDGHNESDVSLLFYISSLV
jgi:hypothetical protein